MKQNEDLVAKMNMSWEEKLKESEELAFKVRHARARWTAQIRRDTMLTVAPS
jgi:hypothetical protein